MEYRDKLLISRWSNIMRTHRGNIIFWHYYDWTRLSVQMWILCEQMWILSQGKFDYALIQPNLLCSARSTEKVWERGETLAASREKATEVGSPDAEVHGGGSGSGVYAGGEDAEETSEGQNSMWRRRRRFSPSRETRVGETETGELCSVSGGRGLFHGENWLGRAGVPCRAGFQRCWCCGPWKVSAWALFPGKRPGTRRGNVLPN